MLLTKISILKDNYIWILYNQDNMCIMIDPGHSENIMRTIEERKWKPKAILLTHDHADHTAGVGEILKRYPKIITYGPPETQKFGVKNIVKNGDVFSFFKRKFFVYFTPGHTMGHISYYSPPYIFCGDVLFSGGCGRVEGNNYREMYNSIKKISNFPDASFLCYAHEYTLSNLIFAMKILPDDVEINRHYKFLCRIFKNNMFFHTSIFYEKKINLFLRTDEYSLKKSLGMSNDLDSFHTFVKLRLIKDMF